MLQCEDFVYGDGHYGPLSLSVEEGACVGITGRSGSGKTRMLRALCDLDPWEGKMSLGDVAAHAVSGPAWRRLVGFLPAESRWWSENVGSHFASEPPSEDLASLGLEPDVLRWPVSRLSSGERHRLSLLRLLVQEPRGLLLDEPTAHLDPASAEGAEELIARYRATHAVPVLWVAHDAALLERVASRSLHIVDGGLREGIP